MSIVQKDYWWVQFEKAQEIIDSYDTFGPRVSDFSPRDAQEYGDAHDLKKVAEKEIIYWTVGYNNIQTRVFIDWLTLRHVGVYGT